MNLKKRFKYREDDLDRAKTVKLKDFEKKPVGVCFDVALYLYDRLEAYNPKAYFMYSYESGKGKPAFKNDRIANTHTFIVLNDSIYIEVSMIGHDHQGIFIFKTLSDLFQEVWVRMNRYDSNIKWGGITTYTPKDESIDLWQFCSDRILDDKEVSWKPTKKTYSKPTRLAL
jgi:hypothetical protein